MSRLKIPPHIPRCCRYASAILLSFANERGTQFYFQIFYREHINIKDEKARMGRVKRVKIEGGGNSTSKHSSFIGFRTQFFPTFIT